MKTLEEVKKHYKEASIIQCLLSEDRFNLEDCDERGIHEWGNAFWVCSKAINNIAIYDNDAPLLGFAKIIK